MDRVWQRMVPAMMSGQCSSKGVTFCTEGGYKMDVKAEFPSGIPPCPALLTAHFSLALVQHNGGPFPLGDIALFPVPCKTARRVQRGSCNMTLPCSQGSTVREPLTQNPFAMPCIWGR